MSSTPMKRFVIIMVLMMFSLLQADSSYAMQIATGETSKKLKIPPTVLNIAKENTYPNPSQDLPLLQPSELSQQLIASSDVKIENPELIHMLNESSISKAPFAFGYRATIYLGHWALNYQSSETAPNWEYQKINTNYYDNRSGKSPYSLHYVQEAQKIVRGGLTAKFQKAEDVQ